MATYNLFKTLVAPTGVENAVYCNFISDKDHNLITACANNLTIYRLNPDLLKLNDNRKLKFECIQSFQLFGTISAISSCRYGSMRKDALVLAFLDAKLSIVEFNEQTGELDTVSIHYFENEIESEGVQYNIYHPVLRVDPNMRCAVMLIYGFKLAVVPFIEEANETNNIEDEVMQDIDNPSLKQNLNKSTTSTTETATNGGKSATTTTQMNTNPQSNLSSYVIDLRKLDNWLTMRIIDIEFLFGYYEPTLFILCESNRTWIGRYAVKNDTCNSISISLNLKSKTNPLIWPVDRLPSDCLKAIAVPQPIGGVLIFAVNSLIYINQSVPSYGVSLNSIAKITSKYPYKDMESTKITLDCAYTSFITTDQLIVSLKGGELYIITLLTDTDSLRSVRGFHIEKGPGSVIANCLIRCYENYLFIGSRLGNSVLLKYSLKSTNDGNDVKSAQLTKASRKQNQKQQRDQQNIDEFDELDQILDLNTDYNEQINANINSYQFEICDILLNIAPCGHTIVGEPQNDYHDFLKPQQERQGNEDEQKQTNSGSNVNSKFNLIDLISTSGHSKNGSISILQRSIRPEIVVSFGLDMIDLVDVIDMWSVSSCYEEKRVDTDDIYSNGDESQINANSPLSTTYLFLTKEETTKILKLANEITELDRTNYFCTRYPTLAVANINAILKNEIKDDNDEIKLNRFILQITPIEFYVYDSNKLLFTYNFTDDLMQDDQMDESQPSTSAAALSNVRTSKVPTVKSVSIVDPYIVILTDTNELFVYLMYENENYYFTTKTSEQFYVRSLDRYKYRNDLSKIECFSVFKDENNLFEVSTGPHLPSVMSDLEAKMKQNTLNASNLLQTSTLMTVDDEDELLYGTSSSNDAFSKPNETFFKQEPITHEQFQMPSNDTSSSLKKELIYWLFTVTTENTLNIYKIDTGVLNAKDSNPKSIDFTLKLYFTFFKFSMAPNLLVNQLSAYKTQQASQSNPNLYRASSLVIDPLSHPSVHEILMMTLGQDKTKPYLIAHIDEEIIIYEAFICMYDGDGNSINKNELNLRFKRLSHDIVIRDRRKRKIQIKNKIFNTMSQQISINELIPQSSVLQHQQSLQQDEQLNKIVKRNKYVPLMRKFNNIAGYNGFFLTGPHPYFVFHCVRSGLTTHPLWFDGAINSFVPLKNSSITLSGFIYLNKKNDVRICTLPLDDCNGKIPIYYDSQWILRKIQLRQTAHFLAYHEESKSYACITSTSEPTNQLMQLGGEDKELEMLQRDENFILPHRDQFSMQLYTASTWEALPLGKYKFSEWEHVTCLKSIRLPYEGHSSGFRTYLAVSTANCYNEDVNSRGRIIIFDIFEVLPEPGQPLTCTKMKTIYDKEQKGPVTCVESVCGNLVGAVGQKIFLWEFRNGELIGRAFLDVNFYIHKMFTLKCFILVADVHHSISLIRYQDDYKKISFVAKDKHINSTYTCEFLVDNGSVSFLSSDSDKNLLNYMYTQESHDNQGGQWLMRKGEFNVGSHINSMFRLKCNVNDPNLDERTRQADRRQVTYFSTLDGGIGYLIPLNEKTFRRLFMLQNALNMMIPHIAALNPKAYRSYRSKRKELYNPQKNILDGDLLFKYFDLSFIDRNEISRKIKSSTEQILNDLIDVYQFTEHF